MITYIRIVFDVTVLMDDSSQQALRQRSALLEDEKDVENTPLSRVL